MCFHGLLFPAVLAVPLRGAQAQHWGKGKTRRRLRPACYSVGCPSFGWRPGCPSLPQLLDFLYALATGGFAERQAAQAISVECVKLGFAAFRFPVAVASYTVKRGRACRLALLAWPKHETVEPAESCGRVRPTSLPAWLCSPIFHDKLFPQGGITQDQLGCRHGAFHPPSRQVWREMREQITCHCMLSLAQLHENPKKNKFFKTEPIWQMRQTHLVSALNVSCLQALLCTFGPENLEAKYITCLQCEDQGNRSGQVKASCIDTWAGSAKQPIR